MIERGDIIGVVLGKREQKSFHKIKFEKKSRYADYMHHYRNYTLHSLLGYETKNEENDQVFA